MRTVLLRLLALCALSVVTISACAGGTDRRETDEAVAVSVAALANTNLVANPSVETPANATTPQFWSTRTGGPLAGTATFSYDTSTAHTGSRSVRIDMSSRTAGDAEWLFAEVPVTPNATYIYRDYFKSNATTAVSVFYRINGGSQQFANIAAIVAASPSDWTTAAYSWLAPPGATTVTVFRRIIGNGTLWLDDVSFQPPQTADLSSGIPNGDMEQASDLDLTKPLAWVGSGFGNNQATYTYEQTGHSGTHSLSVAVTNWVTGDAKWVFPPRPVTPGTRYLYSDFYLATVPSKLTVQFTLNDATTQSFTLNTVPASAGGYTPAYVAFSAPANATNVTVFHRLDQNGFLQIDDATLAPLPPAAIINGVPNGDVEQSDYPGASLPPAWAPGNAVGNNQPTYTYEQTGHSGTHSLSVTMTNYVDGDAKWVFDAQPVTPGVRYLYSDFYLATVPSKVTAQFNLIGGMTQGLTTTTVPASAGFTPAYGSFLAPANATSVTVFHRLDQNGFLQIDDATLSPLPPAPITNGVPNSDLELSDYPGASLPSAWHTNRFGTNTTEFTYVTDPSTGNHSARIDISAYTDGAASWNFDPQPVQAGKAYRITASYRSNIDMNWVATVTVVLPDQTTKLINLQLPAAFASPSAWASYSAKVYLPDNAVDITFYDKITTVGWVELDDVGCVLAPTAPFTRGLVSLTFDDSYLSDARLVLPVLQQHNAVATHYILTGALGDSDRMTLADLAALDSNGDQIAGHTVNHFDLTTLSSTDLATELLSSKQFLESHGYNPLLDFATPYGAYNAPVLAAIKAAYRSHRTVDAGYNTKDDWDIYRLKVQNMRSTTTQAEVDGWAARAAADHSWLIIVYHDVVTDLAAGTIYSTTPASVAAHLTSFETHGLEIETVQQAIDEILPQLVCNDQNVCTTDTLGQDGYCKFTNNASSCDDADACSVGDSCSGAACVSHGTLDCGLYTCSSSSGCKTTCVTGNDCSASGYCKPNACVSSCDDGDPCTDDQADANRTCSSTVRADGSDCGAQAQCWSGFCRATCGTVADCNAGLLCAAGLCTANCDDNNPCTIDSVDPTGLTCFHAPGNAGAVCRDAIDVCDAAETCTGSSALCPADQFASSAFTCRAASNACDAAEHCTGSGTTCPSDGALSCGLYACDTTTGCKTSCVTGAECGSNAYCKAGSCVSSCDDGNACTNDTADANRTCSSTVKSDGSSCGTQLQCSGGYCRKSCGTAADCSAGQTCAAGLCAADCNDNNPCTTDTLDASGTTCSHSALQDGTSCTGANRCQPAVCGGGSCIAAPAVVCAALDQCHVAGTCDPSSGVCSNPIQANGTSCNDGSLCTTGDACNSGACVGTTRSCDDANVCTVDSCNPAVGCVNAPGNAGTVCRASTGVCDAAETCTGSAAACPANQLQPATFTCRAASSACDSPEKCTGTSVSCPSAVDKLAPTLSAGTNQSVLGTCSSFGSISYVYPTASNSASGQCDSPPRVTCTSIAANSFGAHTVTCTAKDSVGNVSNSVSFTVTVLEPLSVSLQSSLASSPTNNVARVGWTVLHSVKVYNCRSQDVTATAAVNMNLTTSVQSGSTLLLRKLSSSTATPNTNGVMLKVGTGSSTTYQYKLGTSGMQTTGSGTLFDTKYWLSTMTASYTSAPAISAGATTARIALTP
jgi:peptidoglycan/xylan/chitin deacetylase (PgdA/CDA1 family)